MPLIQSSKSAEEWINASGPLGPLLQQARQLAALEQLIAAFLPGNLSHFIGLAGIKRNSNNVALHLSVINGAAAARLRQLTPTLLAYVKHSSIGAEITAIEVRVQPQLTVFKLLTDPDSTRDSLRSKSVAISSVGMDSLAQLRQTLSDTPLSRAVGALLDHHRAR